MDQSDAAPQKLWPYGSAAVFVGISAFCGLIIYDEDARLLVVVVVERMDTPQKKKTSAAQRINVGKICGRGASMRLTLHSIDTGGVGFMYVKDGNRLKIS